MYFFYQLALFLETQTSQWVSIIPFHEKNSVMQKVTCCQSLKLVSFIMLLWQDTFCQVMHKRVPSIFVDENSIAFLFVYRKLIGLTLGLDLVHVLTHAWPIETYPLESAVKVDFSVEPTSSIMYFLQLSLGFLLPHTS